MSACDPHGTPIKYRPFTRTEEKCAIVGCEYKTVQVITTGDSSGNQVVEIYDGDDLLPAGTELFTCQAPVPTIPACVTSVELEPVPFTIEGEDCEGNPVEVTGVPGQLTSVVQAPGTVFKVQLCENSKDTEKHILCDVNNGHKVAVITDFSNPAAPVTSYWDIIAGAAWIGDPLTELESCPDSDTESDAQEMCESGTTFLRWFVKKNGEPTGEVFDTTMTGASYTVVDESLVTVGKCETSCAKAPQGVLTSWAV